MMLGRLLRRPGIASQIVMFLVLSEVAFQAVIAFDSYVGLPGFQRKCDTTTASGIAHSIQVLNALPLAGRLAQIEAMKKAFPTADIRHLDYETRVRVPAADNAEVSAASRVLGDRNQVLLPFEDDAPGGRIMIRLGDGSLVSATVPCQPMPRSSADAWLRGIFYSVLVLPMLIWWSRRNIGLPLKRFESVGHDFLQTLDPIDLPVEGAREIKIATEALNAASARNRNLVNERQRMFTAVSHDLLTPLTRLRLRTEFVEDDELREEMSRDIDQMSSMTEATLRYLVEGRGARNRGAVDIATIISTIVNRFGDAGQVATYAGPIHLVIEADPKRMDRAVTNLVDNAVKYAGSAEVTLQVEKGNVVIEVLDHGPGIPAEEKNLMLEPFSRGNKARPIDGSGFGLGLPIVKTIVEEHGGSLALLDRDPRGLKARLVFPYEEPLPNKARNAAIANVTPDRRPPGQLLS